MEETNRRILLTGGTRGIGKAAALQLIDQGHEVIITTRNMAIAQEIKNSLPTEKKRQFGAIKLRLDTVKETNEDVPKIVEMHKERPFDVIILNAGVMFPGIKNAPIDPTFQVNFLGNFILCYALLKATRPDHKLLFIGVNSVLLKYARWPYMPPPKTKLEMEVEYGLRRGISSGWKAYALSKLCLAQLILDLDEFPNVQGTLLHPGNSHTEISKNMPGWQKLLARIFFKNTLVSVEIAAERVVQAVNKPLDPSTKWYYEGQEIDLPIHVNDEKLRVELHEFSEKLIARNSDPVLL